MTNSLFSVSKHILSEGAVVEIIRRSNPHLLDPHIANAGMIYSTEGRRVLKDIYNSYLEIAVVAKLPIVIYAPTWRCQPERLVRAEIKGGIDIQDDLVSFMRSVIEPFKTQTQVFLGAIVGCKGDPYIPDEGLSEDLAYDYHNSQITSLHKMDLDLIQAATLPYLPEATGIARLLGEGTTPYVISFMISPEGRLLDGTPISEAIRTIDQRVKGKPVYYMSNCIHPDHFEAAFNDPGNDQVVLRSRFKGLQANSSKLTPGELNERGELDLSETPEVFAAKMDRVRRSCDLHLVGGCCGTDGRHIRHMARLIKKN